MMHLSEMFAIAGLSLTANEWFFVASNLIIPLGYVFVAWRVVPILPITSWTRLGARAFFFLCALTHLEMAAHVVWEPTATYAEEAASAHMLLIHIPQAFAIWIFAVGFYKDMRNLRAERHTSEPAHEQ